MSHLDAVERALEAAGSLVRDTDAPLVELLRSLAQQVDSTGPDGPGTRLAAAYLTALRSFDARIDKRRPSTVGRVAALAAAPSPDRGLTLAERRNQEAERQARAGTDSRPRPTSSRRPAPWLTG